MMHAVVTGAAGGLGQLIADELETHGYTVHRLDIQGGGGIKVDLADPRDIQAAAIHVMKQSGKVDVLVNCAGYNRLNYLHELEAWQWDAHMHVNARAIYLLTKALLGALTNGTVCNIISNASHMPMTASLAYNASKAAAAMVTKQMARELWPTHKITVFGVSPNRLSGTPMSVSVDEQVTRVRGWTPEQVADKQRAAMAVGEETSPHAVAEFVGWLLSTKPRHKALHGCIMEYGL